MEIVHYQGDLLAWNYSTDLTMNKWTLACRWLPSLFLCSFSLFAFSQSGSLDPTFNPGTGANGTVGAIVVQPDGKIVLGGAFTSFNGTPVGHIVRLLPDGAVDTTFHAGSGFNGTLLDLEVQTDGKLLACGTFTQFDGTTLTGRLVRLNADGTRDTGFVPPVFGLVSINGIAIKSDGRIVICGGMGITTPLQLKVCQLNTDGSPDASFTTGSGFTGFVQKVAVLTNDRLALAGSFTSYAGTARAGLCVLMPNGLLDAGFDPGTGCDQIPAVLEPAANGAFYIGGGFSSYQGGTVPKMFRLSSTGTIDPAFDVGGGPNAILLDILTQPDGRLICAGGFNAWNGTTTGRLCRLEPTGALDTSFDPGSGADNVINCLASEADGTVLAGGSFTSFNGQPINSTARLLNCAQQTWYVDADGDGLGNSSGPVSACLQPIGTSVNPGDCDDADPNIGAAQTYYADTDGDGDGDPNAPLTICVPPVGYVQSNTDCDDADPERYPFAPCNDGNPLTYGDEIGEDCVCLGRRLQIQVSAFLAGPYNGTDMNSSLLQSNVIPLVEPYTALGYMFVNGGGETTTSAALDPAGTFFDVVDWVVLEVRDPIAPTIVLASQACLLHRNGVVTDQAGIDAPQFSLPIGPYHIALRHRNHLGVMTAAPLEVDSITGVTVAFQLPATPTFGTNARQITGGVACLWPGDVHQDGTIMYTGGGNDRDPILQRIGGTLPTATAFGYHQEDVNLDGAVRYTGGGNDRDPILQVIGGSVPTAVRHQGLP